MLIPKAIVAFEKAVHLTDGKDASTLFNFGALLMQAGGRQNLMRAASMLERSLRLRPSHAKNMAALGACKAQLGARAEAGKLMRAALVLDPTDAMVKHNLATFEGEG